MKEIIAIGLLVILVVFIQLAYSFNKKKEQEYKNDERWQQVKLKVNRIVLLFFNLIVCLVTFGFIYFKVIGDSSATITYMSVFQYAFNILLIRYPVEYFALRYYDDKL